jgi:hypothetical protein
VAALTSGTQRVRETRRASDVSQLFRRRSARTNGVAEVLVEKTVVCPATVRSSESRLWVLTSSLAIRATTSCSLLHSSRPAALRSWSTRDVVTRTTPIGLVDVLLLRGREEHASLARDAMPMSVKRHAVRVAAIDDVLRLRARFGKVPVRV